MKRKFFKYHGVIFLVSLDLDEGFDLQFRDEKLLRGKEFSRCSGFPLFAHLYANDTPLTCHTCGVQASQWILTRHRNDKKNKPTLELFGEREGRLVMMTRDHIIPKVYYGYDMVENLRPMCELCNHGRGHEMSRDDIRFMVAHPELYNKGAFLAETT